MSLASQLEALKETYENKSATLRILFEQRLDTLRSNIICFIGNALQDETAKILNQSDETRAFVVDRILEVVSDNLESEKETTIFKLITKMNELTKTNNTLTAENKQLKSDNNIFANTQKHIDDNSEELSTLKQSLTEKTSRMKSQTDQLKCAKDELQIKTHEFDRVQSQNDQSQEHIQKLHEKLENTLRTLQNQRTTFDQHCIENKQFKALNDKNQRELKKSHKQINSLKTALMQSESERLILRKQHMAIGKQLEQITSNQNKQSKEFEKENKSKNHTISALKQKFERAFVENEALKKALHEHSHKLSRKMKKELGKTRILCDDVASLRKQLESERNMSKMYVDELQKLKMELNTKSTAINYSEKQLKNTISAQKKKIRKYYQKMVDSNMSQLQNEYVLHVQELKEQYDETIIQIQNHEQQQFMEEKEKILVRLKDCEEQHTKDKEMFTAKESEIEKCIQTSDELKVKQSALSKEIVQLKETIISKEQEISDMNEEKESFQRLLLATRNENQSLQENVSKLRNQKDNIRQTKFEENSKANAKEYDLRQSIESLTYELKKKETECATMKSKMKYTQRNHDQTEKFNWKYQQKLSLIREFCKNIRREMKNNKSEIEYMKSCVSMHIERIFNEIQISFNAIECKKKEHGLKHELSKSMKDLRKMQNIQLQSMEKQVKYALMSANKIENTDMINDVQSGENVRELNLSGLQNEVNTIKNDLNQARKVLSPKEIIFKKISLPSSITSSMFVSPAPRQKQSAHNKSSNRKLNHRKTNKNVRTSSKSETSFDTATIRKLRSDLQSLESNYKYSKKRDKKKYANSKTNSVESLGLFD